MDKGYEIHNSNKTGIKTKESYVVTRGRTSFLRIIGEDPSYLIMTATASEDNGEFVVCKDKVRLISAALQLGAELGTGPSLSKDRSRREFALICELNLNSGKTAKDYVELDGALSKFFEFYDTSDPSKSEQVNEMREIYQSFAQDDSGDDVYLSDGVWLSSDGSLHDRGR